MGNREVPQREATMKYALLIYSPSTAQEYASAATAPAHAPGPDGDWVKYTRAAREAGVLVAAEQLTHSDTATSVRVRGGGERLITDGPFTETKDHLLGFYLIDVPDLDAALEWATRMPAVNGGTVEVRAAVSGMPWQRELP
jgi:hypothetical protein